MANKKSNDEFRPTGTMAVLAIFIITLVVLWVSIYMIMLQRGLTS